LWIDHLRANGFRVKPIDVEDKDVYRRRFGVPGELASCHTAMVDGYVIEGHVPAEDIKRFLSERPDVKGLAVAGMPAGSPGMDGVRHDPYDVLIIQKDGSSSVFSSYP
jgi:hypothetical protein